MVRGSRKILAVGAVLALCAVQLNFVPGPLRKAAPAAAASAAMVMAPAAFADEIGDAAKKLGDASYDFAKEVDWNNGIFLQAPGQFQPLKALSAIDKMIEACFCIYIRVFLSCVGLKDAKGMNAVHFVLACTGHGSFSRPQATEGRSGGPPQSDWEHQRT